MPAKVYVDAPPAGDFRAMPARGEGLATLKWVTSFPHNPERGLPVVAGALLVSSAETGELLAIMDCAAITSLRTGAAAAVSALALAREDARSVGVIGCGVNGAWAARCLAAAGYGPGVCADPRADAAQALASELGWRTGARERRGGAGRRRHRHPGGRAGDHGRRPAARPAPRGARRRRPRQGRGRARRRSRAAGSSATSGSRRRRAESSRARSSPGRSARRRDRDRRRAARPRARARASATTGHALRLDRACAIQDLAIAAQPCSRPGARDAGAYRELRSYPRRYPDRPDGQIAIRTASRPGSSHRDFARRPQPLVLDLVPGGRIVDDRMRQRGL